MEVKDIVAFEYAKTAERIYNLKGEAIAYKTTPGYGYFPEGSNVGQRVRPNPDEFNSKNFKYGQTTFVTVSAHMSPKSAAWKEYCWTRRRANIISAAILLLKRDGDLSSQAPSGQRRKLKAKSKNYLEKIRKRLDKDPGRYRRVTVWLTERSAARAARAA